MKIYKDIIQGSPEWFAIRKGKMTASHADTIAVAGKGLETYIWSILADAYASEATEGYSNAHMERGKELEEHARAIYELEQSCNVEQVGFIEHNEYVGASPDGLVGQDAGIEIKCHDNVKHFKLICEGEGAIDPSYWWQIQMNMLVSGRKEWDYVAYNPNFERSLLVFRLYQNAEDFEKLYAGIAKGMELMESIRTKYL